MKKLIYSLLGIAVIAGGIYVLTAGADVTPPDGIILINNNATTTYSRTVEVMIPASDEFEVVDMCVSVGTACTQWEPYKKTKLVTLGATPAWYSICGKVRDGAGWESIQKCVAIQYIN
jgi:hypothetical protein